MRAIDKAFDAHVGSDGSGYGVYMPASTMRTRAACTSSRSSARARADGEVLVPSRR
jgi:hypothetical protein